MTCWEYKSVQWTEKFFHCFFYLWTWVRLNRTDAFTVHQRSEITQTQVKPIAFSHLQLACWVSLCLSSGIGYWNAESSVQLKAFGLLPLYPTYVYTCVFIIELTYLWRVFEYPTVMHITPRQDFDLKIDASYKHSTPLELKWVRMQRFGLWRSTLRKLQRYGHGRPSLQE